MSEKSFQSMKICIGAGSSFPQDNLFLLMTMKGKIINKTYNANFQYFSAPNIAFSFIHRRK
jgi:hypothetical protein